MGLLERIRRAFGGDEGRPGRLPSPDSLALVARPQGEPEAQMMRELLDEHGIRAMVKNRDAVSAQAGGMGPTWAYELWVLRRDLRRAREVLGIDGEREHEASDGA
jgi:hypothetical protein